MSEEKNNNNDDFFKKKALELIIEKNNRDKSPFTSGFNFPEVSTQEDIIKKYGGIENVPSELLNKNLYKLKEGVVPEGFEVIQSGNLKGRVVPKDRPKGPARVFAGILDSFFDNATDFDKLGTPISGLEKAFMKSQNIDPEDFSDKLTKNEKKGPLIRIAGQTPFKEIDLSDKSQFELTELGKEKADTKLTTDFAKQLETKTKPTGDLQSQVKDILEAKEEFDKAGLKTQLKQNLLSQGVNIATMPIYTRLLEDAARRRLELDKAMLAAREMMPSNIQKIMRSKQEQQTLAADAEYKRALGIAAQQDAATRFAGLGMQRQFG